VLSSKRFTAQRIWYLKVARLSYQCCTGVSFCEEPISCRFLNHFNIKKPLDPVRYFKKTSKRTRGFAGRNLTSQMFENQMVINQNWTLMLRTMVMKPTNQVTTCEGLEPILIPWPILDFTTVSNLKEITKKASIRHSCNGPIWLHLMTKKLFQHFWR
jgi:hypothetical protein